MTGNRTVHAVAAGLVVAALATGLAATPAPAGGYYGGYHYGGHGYGRYGYGHYGYGHGYVRYGYGHYGYGYGHGYGHYGYGHSSYGYAPHYYGGYSHYGYGYGYAPRSYGGHSYYGQGHRQYGYAPYYHGGGSHYGGYHGGLLYGLLSIPYAVIGTIFGYPYDSPYHGGGSAASTARARAATPYAPAPQGGSAPAPQSGGPAVPPSAGQGSAAKPYGSTGSAGDAMGGAGWRVLAAGDYEGALARFAGEANGHPTQGLPKVGYALSAALAGDLGRGIWAMRRALRIDPHAVHYVYIGHALRPKLDDLVGQYRSLSDRGDGGATFMLAALHYLVREVASAGDEVALAMANGDHHPSTVNLERLIAEAPADSGHGKAGEVSSLSPGDRVGAGYSR